MSNDIYCEAAPPPPDDALRGHEEEHNQIVWQMWRKQAKAVESANQNFIADSTSLAKFDPVASKVRLVFTIILASAAVGGTIGFIVAIAMGDLATTIAGGAVAFGLLLTAGLVNPLQTVERDIIFRRWSDVITHTFLMQASSFTVDPVDLKKPADEASRRFASLAKAYTVCTSQTLDTLQAIAGDGAQTADDSGGTDNKTSPSVEKIETQKRRKGADGYLEVQASGQEPLTYDIAGLPAGLRFCPYCGDVSGTIAAEAADSYSTVVTVQDKEGATAAVTFEWELS